MVNNNVIAINQTLSTTFDSFKQDPTIFSINDLISITNPLPPVEVGSSQLVTPTFRPGLGNNQTGQGQIIFNFPKFTIFIDSIWFFNIILFTRWI